MYLLCPSLRSWSYILIFRTTNFPMVWLRSAKAIDKSLFPVVGLDAVFNYHATALCVAEHWLFRRQDKKTPNCIKCTSFSLCHIQIFFFWLLIMQFSRIIFSLKSESSCLPFSFLKFIVLIFTNYLSVLTPFQFQLERPGDSELSHNLCLLGKSYRVH